MRPGVLPGAPGPFFAGHAVEDAEADVRVLVAGTGAWLPLVAALATAAPARADDLPPPPELLGDPADDPAAAPAPPPAEAPVPDADDAPPPPAPPPPAAPKKKTPPPADARPPDDELFSSTGWGALGGGAVAAAAVGGLTLISPCGCAAPVACGTATCAMGAGALVGHTLQDRPWSARDLLPVGTAAGVGVGAGAAATLAVLITPSIADAVLPDAGANPDDARNNVLAASAITALVAGVALVGGGVLGGWAATAAERALDERAAKDSATPAAEP